MDNAREALTPSGFGAIVQTLAKTITNHPSFADYMAPFMRAAMPKWQSQGIRCQVVENKAINARTRAITLKPNKALNHKHAGQFVDLSIEINGALYTRSFTISSAPSQLKEQGTLTLTVRIHEHGKVTNWMAEHLTRGDIAYVSDAQGDFLANFGDSTSLWCAAGSGITPFISVLASLPANTLAPTTLLYVDRDGLFQSELAQYCANQPNLTLVQAHSQSSAIEAFSQLHAMAESQPPKQAWLCGPHAFMVQAKNSASV